MGSNAIGYWKIGRLGKPIAVMAVIISRWRTSLFDQNYKFEKVIRQARKK